MVAFCSFTAPLFLLALSRLALHERKFRALLERGLA
jgi:hypothetical protein